MKKVLLSLAMLGIMLVPATTHASIFRAGDLEAFSSEEVIHENAYLAGSTVYVDAPMVGDLFVAGSIVHVDAAIEGDIFAASGNLYIDGEVTGDVRVVGSNVQIAGTITGELLALGATVQLLPGAVIEGDMHVAAGELYNAADVGGEAVIASDLLRQEGNVTEDVTLYIGSGWRIGDEVKIGGVLDYTAPESIDIAKGTAAEVIFTQIEIDPEKEMNLAPALAGLAAAWVITKYLAFILAAVLLAWFAPKLAKKQSDETLSEFWYHALRGLAIILLVPLVGGILMMTGIGMVVGWVVFGLFSLMSVLAGVHATVTFGMWLRSISYPKSKKNKVDMNEITALIGAILLGGIALVPVIGWIFVFIWWLASLGALWTRWHKWFEKHRT